eukprot:2982608-Amphidinium_carterae.1
MLDLGFDPCSDLALPLACWCSLVLTRHCRVLQMTQSDASVRVSGVSMQAGIVAPMSARAITSEQFEQLTYEQVKGSGLANRCPTVEMEGSAIKVP